MSRILIVDDAETAEDLAKLLSALGHDTEMAFDVWQAIEAFRQFCPDVIFLDLEMGFFDGFDAARAIRAGIDGQRPVLIAVSSTHGPEIEGAARAVGFDLCMKKPVDTRSVMAIAGPLSRRGPAATNVA